MRFQLKRLPSSALVPGSHPWAFDIPVSGIYILTKRRAESPLLAASVYCISVQSIPCVSPGDTLADRLYLALSGGAEVSEPYRRWMSAFASRADAMTLAGASSYSPLPPGV